MVYSNFICFSGLSLGDAFYFFSLHCRMSNTDVDERLPGFAQLYQRDNPGEFGTIRQTLRALDMLRSCRNAGNHSYSLLQESWKSLHIGEQQLSRKETTSLSHSGIPFEERIRLGHLVFSELRTAQWFLRIPILQNETFPNLFSMFDTVWSAVVYSIVNSSKFDHSSYNEFMQALEIAGKCSIKFGFEQSFLNSLQRSLSVFQQYVTEYFPPSDFSQELGWEELVRSTKQLMDLEGVREVSGMFHPPLALLNMNGRKIISISIFRISSPLLGSGTSIVFLCPDVLIFAQLAAGRYEFLQALHLGVVEPTFCSERSGCRFQTHSGMYSLQNRDFVGLKKWFDLLCTLAHTCKMKWRRNHQKRSSSSSSDDEIVQKEQAKEQDKEVCSLCWKSFTGNSSAPLRCGWCCSIVCSECKGTEVGIPNSMDKTPLRIDVCSACYSVFRRSR